MGIKPFILFLEDYLPDEIIPRQGKGKTFSVENEGVFLKLVCTGMRPLILNKKIVITERDLQAVGLYLAEGQIYVNPHNKVHHSGEIEFANSDVYCMNVVCDLLEKFSVKRSDLSWKMDINKKFLERRADACNHWIRRVKIRPEKQRVKWLNVTGTDRYYTPKTSKNGCLQVYYYSTFLRSIFINFCFKLFDELVENEEKKKIAAILSGYFAGDGNVNFNIERWRREVSFLGNKTQIIERIRKGLKVLGLGRIKETFPKRTKAHTKALRIYNRKDFEILQKYGVIDVVNYKRNKFQKMLKSYARAGVA